MSNDTSSDGPIDLDGSGVVKVSVIKTNNPGVALPWLIDCLHWSADQRIGASTILLSEQAPQEYLPYATGVQPWLRDIFHDFLPPDGGGAAQAMQAFFSILASMQYYARLSEYTKATSANITSL